MFSKFIIFLKRILPLKWHYIFDHSGFRRYFANTGWMFVGQIFSMVMTFFVGVWLARYLGPENYGIINYSLAFVGMFTFIANLGIGTILFRELAKYPEKKDELLGTSFRLLMHSGLIAFSLVVVSSFIFESSTFIRSLIILYSSTFLWSAFSIIQIFFQAAVKAKKNVYASIVAGIASSLLKVLLIISGKGIIWLMLIFVFESLFGTILVIVNYKKNGYNFSAWKYNRSLAKEIMTSSWFMMLAASASYLFMKVDQVMVGKYLGGHSVGLYAAAVRLVEIWYFVPGLICSSLFPAIVNAKKVDEKKYRDRLKKLYILLVSIAVLIAIPSTILAPWAINLLFGNAYSEAAGILKIYVWSGMGLFLLWGLQQYFLAEDKLKMIFYVYLFSMIANITLNVILIPKFGLEGAAWATLISYSAGPIVALLLVNTIKPQIVATNKI